LKIEARRYEENTKVGAARSYQATRATGCSKELIAAWYNIGFSSFQLSIEANVGSYPKIEKNLTLRTQARRYEENTKVAAARSHQATRATGCSKELMAAWYIIRFSSFQLSIEPNVASYAKIEKNPTLRTQARRYEENTKVGAGRSHQATRATGCSKELIAAWYIIRFSSFQLSIEANVASYPKIEKNPTLRTQARRYEENTKVGAARSIKRRER
jgi:hypothetical protein